MNKNEKLNRRQWALYEEKAINDNKEVEEEKEE